MRPICALATARMNCAIHVIRVSGDHAFDLVQTICRKPIRYEGYVIQRNQIIDGDRIVDDVLLNTFVAPKSYTGEDCIEINCHGGVVVADKILQLLTRAGCFPASRGEYTQRALLNKKMDWSQVEAVNNLVHARNEYAISGSIGALTGRLSGVIEGIQHHLFRILGQIEVNIDYPEFDDVPEMSLDKIDAELGEITTEMAHLIQKSQRFLPISQGINVAIVGVPNAGKSSLLNFLLHEDKAIVSDMPGTTRDVVEGWVNVNGLTLHLLDTAGIRKTDDEIEQSGIDRSYAAINQADLIVWLKDPFVPNDLNISVGENQHLITVYTKGDLIQTGQPTISVKNGDIRALMEAIEKSFWEQDFSDANLLVLQSQRQINLFSQILHRLKNVQTQIKTGTFVDLVATDLEECNRLLNDLLGRGENYDFLGDLFANFCVGK